MIRYASTARRLGFTLVELMVVIVLIGILSGMTAMMLNGARADAREKKAQRQIDLIEQILLSELNELSFTAVSVFPSTNSSTTNPQLVQLLARRDRMRMAFPDRRGDLLMPPVRIVAGTAHKIRPPSAWIRMRTRLQLDTGVALPGTGIDLQLGNIFGTAGSISWSGGSSYQLARRVAMDGASSIIPAPPHLTPATDVDRYWTREHESAECLYLILSGVDFNGTPAIEMIGRGAVANTDGDMVPEVIDPWGRPLIFIRWPVGSPSLTDTDPDPLDFAQADPRFVSATTPQARPFRLQPLIVSAGDDGDFGIFHSPASLDPETPLDFSYAETVFTPSPNGRFPDPFFNLNRDLLDTNDDNDIVAARYDASSDTQGGGIGASIPAELTATEDNITNFTSR